LFIATSMKAMAKVHNQESANHDSAQVIEKKIDSIMINNLC